MPLVPLGISSAKQNKVFPNVTPAPSQELHQANPVESQDVGWYVIYIFNTLRGLITYGSYRGSFGAQRFLSRTQQPRKVAPSYSPYLSTSIRASLLHCSKTPARAILRKPSDASPPSPPPPPPHVLSVQSVSYYDDAKSLRTAAAGLATATTTTTTNTNITSASSTRNTRCHQHQQHHQVQVSQPPSLPAYPSTTQPQPALLAAPSLLTDKSIGESEKNVTIAATDNEGPVGRNEGEAAAAAGRCSTPEQDEDNGKGKRRAAKSSPQAASSSSDTIEHNAKGKEVDLLEAELEELLIMLGSLNIDVCGFLSVIIISP